MKSGDVVFIPRGSEFPVVLRPFEESNALNSPCIHTARSTFQLIGKCYLHGFMDGEAFKRPGCFGFFEKRYSILYRKYI
jgi:hypothetical protein